MLTLVWGLPGDGPLARVVAELDHLGTPYYLLDQRRVPDTEVHLDGGTGGRISVGTDTVDLAQVTAAYVRPHDSRRVPGAPADHALAVDDALSCWSEMTAAFVVNRLSAMAGNGSKPWQLRRIAAAGFAVPDTLVTTDPAAARAFWRRHGEIAYKSVSGVRSRVARLARADAARLDAVAGCPTQLQQYVPGTDVRVHVVGGRLFATEVTTDADDYRYAADAPVLRPLTLPTEVAARCLRLATALGLPVTGIDLRRTPTGDWYCFEANPSPAFTYYEHATGQPIAAAIATLLTAAAFVRRRPDPLTSGIFPMYEPLPVPTIG